ncbi:VOC family protein [Poseidonocella sp. HB161398]|uniref:VOC family protein n=1 Tax=Poseidonocella sp. HB161398 TaxID=2320855 RepID=UPI0014864978|nr:VOC family protein [Poseidonocella sp. HB161398]
MQIDHVFVFPRDLPALEDRLGAAGLVPSFGRRHPGQGTANLCYCFENTYLELLWIEDRRALRDPRVRRTGLAERGSGHPAACPFGLAWRGDPDDPAPEWSLWRYHAPFLPDGAFIPVAAESDDMRHPMVFRSPATAAPADWTDGRAGGLQSAAGLGPVRRIILDCPRGFRAGPVLRDLAARTMLTLRPAEDWGLELEVASGSGSERVGPIR